MECKSARSMLFRLMDDELPPEEQERLGEHLRICLPCAREKKILMIPRRIARSIPALEPSPFFYARLKARLERESQSITIWQVIVGLSRQIVPALATLTLVIISMFAYLEYSGSGPDLYQAYDSIFLAADRTGRMVIAEEITDESVLHALAESTANRNISESRQKK
jgi:hypothetical protein